MTGDPHNATMPTTSAALSFAALAFVLIAVPGPSVMFVISRGIALGRRAALETVAGNAVGIYAQVAFVALGLGAVIERSVVLYSALKFAGAGYLVWLGIQSIRHRSPSVVVDPVPEPAWSPPARPTWRGPTSAFRDGAVVGLANPKSIVFFAALLPQFVDQSRTNTATQMLVLGLIFVAIALVLDSLWALAAGSARHWLARHPRRLERMSVGGGVTMIGLGALLAVSGRRQ